jgi:hypothetical protein
MPRAVPHEKLSKFLTQRIGQTQEGKRFFFAKKNQKTFARLPRISPRQPCKKFLLLFSKRSAALPRHTLIMQPMSTEKRQPHCRFAGMPQHHRRQNVDPVE